MAFHGHKVESFLEHNFEEAAENLWRVLLGQLRTVSTEAEERPVASLKFA